MDKSPANGSITSFTLRGMFGPRQMSAEWQDGCLAADPELFEAAEDLVRSAATFTVEDGREIEASLSAALPAFVTMVRCFGQITKAVVDLETIELITLTSLRSDS